MLACFLNWTFPSRHFETGGQSPVCDAGLFFGFVLQQDEGHPLKKARIDLA
jgi:hypothetical protein